jgi:predicted MFS family arabinose efflux permease
MLSASSGVFTAGFIIECVLGTAGFAYFFAMVRSIDPTDQIYVGYTAFQSVGIAGATFAAGVLLNNFGPVVMLTAAGACLVASLFIWLLALRLSVRFPA